MLSLSDSWGGWCGLSVPGEVQLQEAPCAELAWGAGVEGVGGMRWAGGESNVELAC